MELKQIRIHDLIKFLKFPPSNMAGDPKGFLKTQRVRLALEKAIPEYLQVFKDYAAKEQEELAPFKVINQQYVEKYSTMSDEEKATALTIDANTAQLDKQFAELMQPLRDELNKFVDENKNKPIDVTIDANDLDQVKIYFEQKGHEFWADGDAYMEVALALDFT